MVHALIIGMEWIPVYVGWWEAGLLIFEEEWCAKKIRMGIPVIHDLLFHNISFHYSDAD